MTCPDCGAALLSTWIETPEGEWWRAWSCKCKLDARRIIAMPLEDRRKIMAAMADRVDPSQYVDLWAVGEEV